eukprot:CAMPEP_0181256194 /NCGR_PEP_ID=MMETSP1096-20121128/49574_1 /TAXON_ID=156174 ORGANISM="Chrysochromulina ericina, Strain CCMP281" /NCGR_SAMPLE_ID=MMETSP1096 /ASSEMBLY_ACC=CAM_ASM_000453 /LENGTH=105 /DNA_ID=CAMNT_0023354415 /DNA_START=167 /DNA_END=481 /DNA_ORIENTATION=+
MKQVQGAQDMIDAHKPVTQPNIGCDPFQHCVPPLTARRVDAAGDACACTRPVGKEIAPEPRARPGMEVLRKRVHEEAAPVRRDRLQHCPQSGLVLGSFVVVVQPD